MSWYHQKLIGIISEKFKLKTLIFGKYYTKPVVALEAAKVEVVRAVASEG